VTNTEWNGIIKLAKIVGPLAVQLINELCLSQCPSRKYYFVVVQLAIEIYSLPVSTANGIKFISVGQDRRFSGSLHFINRIKLYALSINGQNETALYTVICNIGAPFKSHENITLWLSSWRLKFIHSQCPLPMALNSV
jgi:hypothetical protein